MLHGLGLRCQWLAQAIKGPLGPLFVDIVGQRRHREGAAGQNLR